MGHIKCSIVDGSRMAAERGGGAARTVGVAEAKSDIQTDALVDICLAKHAESELLKAREVGVAAPGNGLLT